MNVADVTASLNSLITSHRQASAEISNLTPDDPFLPILQAFITKSHPEIEKLKQLHRDLLTELSSVLVYFAEKPGSQVEDIFLTVLTFALALQKAAGEMSKYPDLPSSQASKAPRKPPAIGPEPVIHVAGPSGTDETDENDGTPTGTVAQSQVGLGLGVPDSLLTETGRRGTLTRGEFDEAIRTIHGGARRRERREAMAGSMAGSVKLGRIILDGSGTATRARAVPGGKPSGGHARLGSVFR